MACCCSGVYCGAAGAAGLGVVLSADCAAGLLDGAVVAALAAGGVLDLPFCPLLATAEMMMIRTIAPTTPRIVLRTRCRFFGGLGAWGPGGPAGYPCPGGG